MGTYNRRVKFGVKIPKPFGKNVRKTQGGFFLTHNRLSVFFISLQCFQCTVQCA